MPSRTARFRGLCASGVRRAGRGARARYAAAHRARQGPDHLVGEVPTVIPLGALAVAGTTTATVVATSSSDSDGGHSTVAWWALGISVLSLLVVVFREVRQFMRDQRAIEDRDKDEARFAAGEARAEATEARAAEARALALIVASAEFETVGTNTGPAENQPEITMHSVQVINTGGTAALRVAASILFLDSNRGLMGGVVAGRVEPGQMVWLTWPVSSDMATFPTFEKPGDFPRSQITIM